MIGEGSSEDFQPLSREKVRLVRSLARRRERRKRGLYLLEGRRLVEETISLSDDVKFIYGRPDELSLLRQAGHEGQMFVVEDSTDDLFLTESAQGIGAVASIHHHDAATILGGSGPILLLDQINDPGNLGTIVRTADWFGFRSLLLTTGSVDPWNPKSVRASMGGILRVAIGVDVSEEVISRSGRTVIGLTLEGDEILDEAAMPSDGIYVVGSEGEGISSGLLQQCDRKIRIPGGGGESLNAAMATTLLLWELFRADQQSFPVDPER